MAYEKSLALTKLASGFSLKTTLVAGSTVALMAVRIVVPVCRASNFDGLTKTGKVKSM